jgi:hypothetical protein
MAHIWEIITLSLIACYPNYNSSLLHMFNMSINSIKQQAMGGPPATGWAGDWWLTIKSWHLKKCHNQPQQALGSTGINHRASYKETHFLKLNVHYQTHIKIVPKETEIHTTKPHHKTVLRWHKLHLSTLTAGKFTSTKPKVSRLTWANNFTR